MLPFILEIYVFQSCKVFLKTFLTHSLPYILCSLSLVLSDSNVGLREKALPFLFCLPFLCFNVCSAPQLRFCTLAIMFLIFVLWIASILVSCMQFNSLL